MTMLHHSSPVGPPGKIVIALVSDLDLCHVGHSSQLAARAEHSNTNTVTAVGCAKLVEHQPLIFQQNGKLAVL